MGEGIRLPVNVLAQTGTRICAGTEGSTLLRSIPTKLDLVACAFLSHLCILFFLLAIRIRKGAGVRSSVFRCCGHAHRCNKQAVLGRSSNGLGAAINLAMSASTRDLLPKRHVLENFVHQPRIGRSVNRFDLKRPLAPSGHTS